MTRTEKIEGTDTQIQGALTSMEDAGWEVRNMVLVSYSRYSDSADRSSFWVTFWRDADR